MSIIITDKNWRDVRQERGVIQRVVPYGSQLARDHGMVPFSDKLDVLIPWDEMKDRIEEANALKIMPIHHLKAAEAPIRSQGRTNFCFPAGTLVRMADGSQKPIEKIAIDDEVVSAEGNVQPVMQVMKRKHDGKICKLLVRGHRGIYATPEHPFLTKRGYIPLKELKVGETGVRAREGNDSDLIRMPKYAPASSRSLDISGITAIRPVTLNYKASMSEEVQLNRQFGRLVGLFLAEGHTTQSAAFWSFNINELETLVAEVANAVYDCLGLTAKVVLKHDSNTAQVQVHSTECAVLFEELCGHLAEGKRVSSHISTSPAECLKGVLSGWMDGDVNVGKRAVTVSKELALNMFDIANAVGLCPSMHIHTTEGTRGDGIYRQRSWSVGWGESGRAWAEQDDGAQWRRVKGIETYDYDDYVYNLEVENDHSYIADGLGVHNCWAYGLGMTVEASQLAQNLPYARLAPATLGHAVGWRNRGNYLSSAIKAARERGFATSEYAPDGVYNTSTFKDGWIENALNYRPLEFTDVDNSGKKYMAQQCASLLCYGESLYTAYNWWGHALSMMGVEWDETQKYNLKWIAWNSHNDGPITMTGSRGVPDEAYATRLTTFSQSN